MEPAIKTLKSIPGTKKVTWALKPTSNNSTKKGELYMNGDAILTSSWTHLSPQWSALNNGANLSFYVRQFTKRMDLNTDLPVTIVSAYNVTTKNGVVRMTPDQVKSTYTRGYAEVVEYA